MNVFILLRHLDKKIDQNPYVSGKKKNNKKLKKKSTCYSINFVSHT